MNPVAEILIIVILILANGVFAMSEAALISARKARLQQRANDGDARARAALKLANNPGLFVATTQIGITLISVLLGAVGGATLSDGLTVLLRPILGSSAESISFSVVIIAITFFSLLIGELIPKQLALSNPEQIASVVALPMGTLARITAPLVHLLNGLSGLLLRLIGVRPSDEPGVTEEEIKVMIDQGTQAGTFEATERELLNRIFRLDDVPIEAIMTPRTEVAWLDVNDSIADVRRKVMESGKSRFPVAQGSLDNVLGVVRAKDLLARALGALDKHPLDLRSSLQPSLFVPGTISTLDMLQRFKESTVHLALVIDEYGGLQGVVTMTDVVNKLLGGEFLTEGAPKPNAVRREDGSWLLDGMMTIDEIKETLDIKALPGEDEGDFQTLGGFMMQQIGRIPAPADHFEVNGLRFEVMDMDGRRVDKVLVMPEPPPEKPE